MTDDKWTMCKLCGGKELVRMTQMDGSRFTVAECSGCLIRKQDKLNAEHAKAVAKLIAENVKLREETQELNDLFDLQQTRMLTATKKWQEATGNPGIFPDLGRLLEWLLANMETNDG